MPSQESLQFVRVVYDDRYKFPWVVIWGYDHVWCRCRSREAAIDSVSELRGVCDVFREWAARADGGE